MDSQLVFTMIGELSNFSCNFQVIGNIISKSISLLTKAFLNLVTIRKKKQTTKVYCLFMLIKVSIIEKYIFLCFYIVDNIQALNFSL